VARTERTMQATPEQIWAVLADAKSYEHWVVGAKDIRDADGSWPAVGSTLQHTSGFGPFNLKDNTKVLESDEPHRIVLEARGRPLGIARIEMILEPEGGGTKVTMVEEAVRPVPARALNPAINPLIHSRNVETLRRLEELATKGADTPNP
jgi:uncharacterized protein YndB with AHSA1/START domain